jgi:AhpD family alkylhydroperoxidase
MGDRDGFMTGVRFENTRFDPDLTPFHDVAKEMAALFGYSAELSLDPRLAELLRLRVAQLNPCSYCLILHTQVADRIGIPSEVVAHLAGWRESAMFSLAEKVALAYCEGLTLYDDAQFPRLHDELRLHFEEKEIAEIAAVIINMNVWTRLKLAQGAVPAAE